MTGKRIAGPMKVNISRRRGGGTYRAGIFSDFIVILLLEVCYALGIINIETTGGYHVGHQMRGNRKGDRGGDP